MRARTYNILVSMTILVFSICGWLSLQRIPSYSMFAYYSLIIAMVVSAGMVLRTSLSTAFMVYAEHKVKKNMPDTDEEEEDIPDQPVMEIAVMMSRTRDVAENFVKWMSTQEGRLFFEESDVILANIADAIDGDGIKRGFWLLFVGTPDAYRRMKDDLAGKATIIPYWPYDEDAFDYVIKEFEDEEEPEDMEDAEDILPDLTEEVNKDALSQLGTDEEPSDGNGLCERGWGDGDAHRKLCEDVSHGDSDGVLADAQGAE